ncbi:MAG: hypothetical protein SGILL_010107, partial [Bacillariaceae sp.]
MPHLLSAKPRALVTPNPSFGDRDSSNHSMEGSCSNSSSLPMYVPSGSPTSSSTQTWDSRRSSVGLPSAYPGHGRTSSLAEDLMEELKDFDEFYEHEPASMAMEVDSAASASSVDIRRNSQPSSYPTSSAREQQDDLLNGGAFNVSPVPRRSEPKTHISARHNGKHRRNRNQAMG